MRKSFIDAMGLILMLALSSAAPTATAEERGYRHVVQGVAVYFGIVPSELVRGHPVEHPEGTMHGGVTAGESHVVVALFDDRTGQRLTNVEVNARVTDDRGLDVRKPLTSMTIAGGLTYGNYFRLPGPGPFRFEIRIRFFDVARELTTEFTWARS